jgi:hypothetical protein
VLGVVAGREENGDFGWTELRNFRLNQKSRLTVK